MCRDRPYPPWGPTVPYSTRGLVVSPRQGDAAQPSLSFPLESLDLASVNWEGCSRTGAPRGSPGDPHRTSRACLQGWELGRQSCRAHLQLRPVKRSHRREHSGSLGLVTQDLEREDSGSPTGSPTAPTPRLLPATESQASKRQPPQVATHRAGGQDGNVIWNVASAPFLHTAPSLLLTYLPLLWFIHPWPVPSCHSNVSWVWLLWRSDGPIVVR